MTQPETGQGSAHRRLRNREAGPPLPFGGTLIEGQIGLVRDPVTQVSRTRPGLPRRLRASAPVSHVRRTISLTNVTDTRTGRAAAV